MQMDESGTPFVVCVEPWPVLHTLVQFPEVAGTTEVEFKGACEPAEVASPSRNGGERFQ